jgi:hypothetical protein
MVEIYPIRHILKLTNKLSIIRTQLQIMKSTIWGLSLSILVFCLVSCNKTELDKNILKSEAKYFKLVEIIKDNRIKINSELLNDNITTFHKQGESFWNEYYFTNYILSDIPELKPLEVLWKEKLLEENPRFNIIKLRSNGIIIFTAKAYSYCLFGTKYHYLIYNPTNITTSYYPTKTKSKVIEHIEISKNWSYVIEKVYFDWD